ncbi:MAG: hypothetical protein WAT16_01025, partial [Saprospiraceae bacterium]
ENQTNHQPSNEIRSWILLVTQSIYRETGKNKFLEYIEAILQVNVKQINDHQLDGQFTSLYVSLITYRDEAFKTTCEIRNIFNNPKFNINGKSNRFAK